MKDEQLEHHHSYLDVELSVILNFYLHINNICKKTSSVLRFLKSTNDNVLLR